MDSATTVVRRYYEELWNQQRPELIPQLISERIEFRGSLGIEALGHKGFRQYMETVHAAFPDFHNEVEELIAQGDRVAARLRYRGTHRGAILGFPPGGRVIEYVGAAFFTVSDQRITRGWVLGDIETLRRQLTGSANLTSR